jgi:hypothetical protein
MPETDGDERHYLVYDSATSQNRSSTEALNGGLVHERPPRLDHATSISRLTYLSKQG